jgi:hypothetical protein
VAQARSKAREEARLKAVEESKKVRHCQAAAIIWLSHWLQ